MWSSSYTGNHSIFTDSCHRIYIELKEDALLGKEILTRFQVYQEEKFFHFSIPVLNKKNKSELNAAIKSSLVQLKFFLSEQTTHPKEDLMDTSVFFSLQVDKIDEVDIKQIIDAKTINLIIFVKDKSVRRDMFVSQFMIAKTFIDEYAKDNSLAIGIGGIDDTDDLEWILYKIPKNCLNSIRVGCVSMPCVRTRAIDLAHTWGCNVIISLAKSTEDVKAIQANMHLQEMESNYGVPAVVVLAKCLLQLGCIVGLDEAVFPLIDRDYLKNNFSRLVHPFVNRKQFVSSNKIISLAIKEEDVQRIFDASEQEESKLNDWKWRPHVNGLNPVKQLTF